MRYRVLSGCTLVRDGAVIARGGDVVEFDLELPSEAAYVRSQIDDMIELGNGPPDGEIPRGQYADRAMGSRHRGRSRR